VRAGQRAEAHYISATLDSIRRVTVILELFKRQMRQADVSDVGSCVYNIE
jgi:hypothetical protein